MQELQATKVEQVIDPVLLTSTDTASGTMDLLGSDYATIVINNSIELNTNATGPTFALTESDDLTTYVTFDSDFARATEDLTAAKPIRYDVDTRSRKRYLKLQINTPANTNEDITVAASVVLGQRGDLPTNTADMIESGGVVVIG